MPIVLIVGLHSSDLVICLAGLDPGGTVSLGFELAVWATESGSLCDSVCSCGAFGRGAFASGNRRGGAAAIGSIAFLLVLAMAVQAIVELRTPL